MESLELSGNNLLEFPLSVLHFRRLKHLSLRNNLIDDISSASIIRTLRKATLNRKLHIDLRQNRYFIFFSIFFCHFISLTCSILCSFRLTAVPPELYTLHNVRADTSSNPLLSGLVFPAWFFGVKYDRITLLMQDFSFLFIGNFFLFFFFFFFFFLFFSFERILLNQSCTTTFHIGKTNLNFFFFFFFF